MNLERQVSHTSFGGLNGLNTLKHLSYDWVYEVDVLKTKLFHQKVGAKKWGSSPVHPFGGVVANTNIPSSSLNCPQLSALASRSR